MKIRRILLAGLLAGTALLSAGCGTQSKYMAQVAEPAIVAAPKADAATIVIVRGLGFDSFQSTMFDVTDGTPKLLGIVSSRTRLAYPVPAGKRRLMVIGESASFLDADLLPGRTYYARITGRPGSSKAYFALEPIPATSPQLAEELKGGRWVENTPAAEQWAQRHKASIEAKMHRDLPRWQAQANTVSLKPGDGR